MEINQQEAETCTQSPKTFDEAYALSDLYMPNQAVSHAVANTNQAAAHAATNTNQTAFYTATDTNQKNSQNKKLWSGFFT